MSIKLTNKWKIAIGVVSFTLIMAVICWMVTLALLDTDIKTEVYGAKFDYVDDAMYDNAYVTMSGGKWQLYRGGDAISRTFGQLEYVGDGLFFFVNSDGNGWGYVNTSGSVIGEFNRSFKPLLPTDKSSVAVEVRENGFTVRTVNGVRTDVDGEFLGYDEFRLFYEAFGDSFVAYSGTDGYGAVNTATGKTTVLPFAPRSVVAAVDGYITVGSDEYVTYDAALARQNYLNGALPVGHENADDNDYYDVAGGSALRITIDGGKTTVTAGGGTFELATEERVAVFRASANRALLSAGDRYYYWSGTNVETVGPVRLENISGGVPALFSDANERVVAMDEDCNIMRFNKAEIVTLYRTKEKNRAQYTVAVDYLVGDGRLYGLNEDGKFKEELRGVVYVVSDDDFKQSRIVTLAEGKTTIYDAFFNKTAERTAQGGALEVFDAFLPVYVERATGSGRVILPRGELTYTDGDKIELMYCTDKDNYFIVRTSEDGLVNVHGKDGALLGDTRIGEGEQLMLSQSQLFIVREKEIDFVSRDKKIEIDTANLQFSENKKWAVAVESGKMTVINLNEAAVSEERLFAGGVTVTNRGENTFIIRANNTQLYGIVNDGRTTLAPTYKQLELHKDFVIVSVDDASSESATYWQADFSGKRMGKNYYAIASTEGLTMAASNLESVEIMNSRGRVILSGVTYVPMTKDGFDFMKSYAYDEETGSTVAAIRRDNSRLLVVTAEGFKRVISITRDSW